MGSREPEVIHKPAMSSAQTSILYCCKGRSDWPKPRMSKSMQRKDFDRIGVAAAKLK